MLSWMQKIVKILLKFDKILTAAAGRQARAVVCDLKAHALRLVDLVSRQVLAPPKIKQSACSCLLYTSDAADE